MPDSKEIEKRTEYDKHYMNYNPGLFYFHSFSSIILAILNDGSVLPIEKLFTLLERRRGYKIHEIHIEKEGRKNILLYNRLSTDLLIEHATASMSSNARYEYSKFPGRE